MAATKTKLFRWTLGLLMVASATSCQTLKGLQDWADNNPYIQTIGSESNGRTTTGVSFGFKISPIATSSSGTTQTGMRSGQAGQPTTSSQSGKISGHQKPGTSIVLAPLPPRDWTNKTRIAVFPVQASKTALSDEDAGYITDLVQGTLVSTDYFDVMEQRELRSLLGTQELQSTDLYDNSGLASQFGQLLRVSVLVMGRIGKLDNTYSINLRMVEVDSSRILSTVALHHEGRKSDLLMLSEKVANQLAQQYYEDKKRRKYANVEP